MADSFWDAPLSNEEERDNDFPVLPEGRYDFEVRKATAKIHEAKPGGKIGRCGQIDLELLVEGATAEGRDVTVHVFESLYTASSTAWKMTAFAKSIGIWRDGMTPGELVRECLGCVGIADLYLDEYNGQTRNKVKSFVSRQSTSAPAKTEAPKAAAPARRKKAPQMPAAPVTVDSDDLPF